MRLRVFLFAVLPILIHANAQADFVEQTLFDNFGKGNSFNTSFGYILGGANDLEQGPLVTIDEGSFFLQSIDAAIGSFTGNNSATLSVYSEVNGTPGEVLESVTVSGLPPFGGPFAPTTFHFSGKTILDENQSYFLIGGAADDLEIGNSQFLWAWNNTGDERTIQVRSDGGIWEKSQNTTSPAFRINGTVVPEPSCLIFFVLALGVTARSRQRSIAET